MIAHARERCLPIVGLLVLLGSLVSIATAAGGTPALSGLTTWTAAGSRLGLLATTADRRHGYLWVEQFGSSRPRLLRTRPPIGQEEIDQLAAGPNGTWGCLERSVGNTESYYSVDVVSSKGGGAQVATAGGPTGESTPPIASIPQIFGDGNFLGYLFVTPTGLVQLFQITPTGHGKRIANLVGVTAPQEVAIANGSIAIRELDGIVDVYTTGGQ